MSQEDLIVSPQPSGISMREEINDSMQALTSFMSGATAPTTPYADQFYFNETTLVLWKRNGANTAWERAPILPQPAATTAAMSALDGATYPAGQTVLVLAGTTPGDELGGWFEARSSGDTVDGVTVFAHDAGGSLRWHRIVPTPGAASLPAGVVPGATDANGRFKMTAQAVSGELIDFENVSAENIGRVATTSNGYLQFVIFDKGTTNVLAALTSQFGLILAEYVTPPSTPASGEVYIYAKSADGSLYMKNDTGTEFNLVDNDISTVEVTTTPYTVLSTQRRVRCSGSASVLNLSPIAQCRGKDYLFINRTAGSVTITPDGSETLEASGVILTGEEGAVHAPSTGTVWDVI